MMKEESRLVCGEEVSLVEQPVGRPMGVSGCGRTQTCRSGARDGKDLVVNTSRGKRPLGTTAEDEKIRESEMNLLFPVLL